MRQLLLSVSGHPMMYGRKAKTGGQLMLRIPMDSPFEGTEAVVYTTFGLLRGKIVQMSDEGVSLTVNGLVRHLSSKEIRSVAQI